MLDRIFDDGLCIILSFLELFDKLECALVCKQINRMCWHPASWPYIDLDYHYEYGDALSQYERVLGTLNMVRVVMNTRSQHVKYIDRYPNTRFDFIFDEERLSRLERATYAEVEVTDAKRLKVPRCVTSLEVIGPAPPIGELVGLSSYKGKISLSEVVPLPKMTNLYTYTTVTLDELEILLSLTPNLKTLTIYTYGLDLSLFSYPLTELTLKCDSDVDLATVMRELPFIPFLTVQILPNNHHRRINCFKRQGIANPEYTIDYRINESEHYGLEQLFQLSVDIVTLNITALTLTEKKYDRMIFKFIAHLYMLLHKHSRLRVSIWYMNDSQKFVDELLTYYFSPELRSRVEVDGYANDPDIIDITYFTWDYPFDKLLHMHALPDQYA